MIGNRPYFTKGILARFEPMDWRDYALIPFWFIRFLFFWLIWQFMIRTRIILRKRGKYYGRRHDPTPIMCPRCLWSGPVRWLIHTYHSCGDGDVEPVDECPRCGYAL